MGLGFHAWCTTSMEQLRLEYQCISVYSWQCSAILSKGDLHSVRNRGNVKNTNPRWQWPGMCGLSHTHATLPPVIIFHHYRTLHYSKIWFWMIQSVQTCSCPPISLPGVQRRDNVPSSLPNTLPEQTLKPGLASGVTCAGFQSHLSSFIISDQNSALHLIEISYNQKQFNLPFKDNPFTNQFYRLTSHKMGFFGQNSNETPEKRDRK